jgi:superfamily II DNA or RNA helicase
MNEIAYIIDENESKKHNMLVIRLAQLKKEGTNTILYEATQPFTGATLRQFASPKDKELIENLIKHELEFLRQKTGRIPRIESTLFHFIHISSMHAIPTLKLLNNSFKLYFKTKQIIADFFEKVEFYYRLESLTENRVLVAGRLKWRDTDIDIRECDWIGAGMPPWLIRGMSLKIISTEITSKELLRFYQEDSLILTASEKAIFLDNLDPNDPDGPKIVTKGASLEEMKKQADPYPLLILKDRSGAFADLWMEYGGGRQVAFHEAVKELKATQTHPPMKRQIESENNWERDLLETDFIKKNVDTSHYYCPSDKVAKSLTFLLELGWSVQDWKKRPVIRQESLHLAIEQNQQALIVKGRVAYGNHEAQITDVMGAFNRRERFVQLGTDSVGLVPTRWDRSDLQELADEGEIVGDAIRVKKNRIGVLDTLLNHSLNDQSLIELKERVQNFSHIEDAPPGKKFKGELRPYQQQGVNWLSFLMDYGFHGILADDMGLGKTIQVLAFISRLQGTLPHLIVVPTSLLFNWKNEIRNFLPESTPYIHQGSMRSKSVKELALHPIILTSYATLRIDLPLFQELSYQSLILDEAQVIKNAHTQTAQAVCSLQAQFRLSISGTPVENHLNELWSHFHFLIPDLFGDEKQFEADLLAAQSDSRYLQRIKKKIAPFILRRKKEEVAKDLPDRIDQVVWVEMSEEQRGIYNRFLAGVQGGLLKKVELEGASKHRIEILEAILRLRQICCHPLLVPSSDGSLSQSAKFDALIQDLETAVEEGRKVLVYSQFTSMLHLMTKTSQEKGWKYAYLDGSTVNREKIVASFQDDPTISLFFISLKAGGVGLNLTAADYVFLYDPWWNEAVEDQAINRAHRLGRRETVIAKRFVTVDTIEEKIMKLKSAKRGAIDEIFDESVGNLNFTSEDLYNLLQVT